MKIYIDHLITQSSFATDLVKRIKLIAKDIKVESFFDLQVTEKNLRTAVLNALKEADILVPLITADYISLNPIEITEKLIEIGENKNKYLLPLIYEPTNWSSINWIVKSKVFPSDGFPLSELTDNKKAIAINDLIQTIENILVKSQEIETPTEINQVKDLKTKEKIIFISHDHDDADFAELLKLQLEKNKITGWIDSERLKIGQDWREEIDEGIINSIAIIAIMTPEARKSEYVTYEWAFAWGKGKKIFPLMLKQTPLHPRLESLQYLDFTNRVTRPWDKLIDSIKELVD